MPGGDATKKKTGGDELAIRPAEAAHRLGISESWCYRLIERGEIPSFRSFGRRILVPVKALEEMLASEKKAAS